MVLLKTDILRLLDITCLFFWLLNFFQVRHGPSIYDCSLKMENDEHDDVVAVVKLSEDDQGLAAGQYAAFYEGSICIGSGVILESWDDQGFPVCEMALEIARMEDKSKLGKPVKIKEKSQIGVEGSETRSLTGVKAKNTEPKVSTNNKSKVSKHEGLSSFSLVWLQQLREKWLRVF